MADALRGGRLSRGQVGVLQGICLNGPSDWRGQGTDRHMQVGVSRNDVQGLGTDLTCIELLYVGFWRFRWAVAAGTRTIRVYAKQVTNQSPRPSLKVKANPDIGVAADVEVTVGAGTGWLQTPVATITPTSNGVVYVELHNNLVSGIDKCYFDVLTTS